jgi:ATP-binding cassette subfamily F protein 3
LILVSHDRDFLQGLTEKVYEFKDEMIKEYLGDINYFLEKHDLDNMREVEKRTKTITENKKSISNGKKNFKDAKIKKQLQNKLSKIEAEISRLEKEVINHDADILENFDQVTADKDFFMNYQAKKDMVSELMQEWEELQERIDVLQ